jgi:hypothetical protein
MLSLFSRALALAAALAAAGAGCGRQAPDLLRGARPARVVGVANASAITDGEAAVEGDTWNAPAAAVFEQPGGLVEYDLGRSLPIRAAVLQGDNNDEYVVSGSDDGALFHEIWVAGPVAGGGLRARASPPLDDRARWIRLSARGGDGHYAVSLLGLSSGQMGDLAAGLTHPPAEGYPARFRTRLLELVLALGLWLFGCGAGSSRRRVLLLALAPAVALAAVAAAAGEAWPVGATEVSFARAAAAAIALLALIRAAAFATRFPARRALTVIACAAAALLAFATFYNLGRAQGWNDARRRPLHVHTLDMLVYQPFAKYFDELRYDGVYAAAVLAYAEDARGGSLASLGDLQIRDLRDHHLGRVATLEDHIRAVRGRFSDARWQDFKQDMSFFREAMGPAYLTSLADHGANAPPAWVFFARLLLGHVTASEGSLTAAGFVDGLLFVGMALAIAATFGLLPMLVAMTVFGANDLYMFGSNWAGATLRHDWMALLAFAACALARRRWGWGGAFLGLAAVLRAFPAVALAGAALPPALWLAGKLRRRERPTLRALGAENGDALRVLAAAAATIVGAVVVTGALYSFAAWAEWWRKISMLNADFATNEVSLRALLAGTDPGAPALYAARRGLYLLAQLGALAAFVAVARRRPLHEAMLLALPLAFAFTNPVNYHAHFLFLLVLVGARGDALPAAAPLLVMCVAQYWATFDPDAGRHFQLLTALMFGTLAAAYARIAAQRD